MKAVMIIYNQTHSEKVEYMLEKLNIRGFTQWEDIKGRGTETGNPHLGTHTWPEINSSILSIVPDEQVDKILNTIEKIDNTNTEVGIRAFVWNIEKTV